VATLGDKVRDFVTQKIQLIEFLACRDFFICRITCARVATHAIFIARWGRDNFQKHRITMASKKSLVQPRLNTGKTAQLQHSKLKINKKTCGLSKTGPYKPELICEPLGL